jgi:hypothetical protein
MNSENKIIFAVTEGDIKSAAGHYFQEELDDIKLEEAENLIYNKLYDSIGGICKEVLGDVLCKGRIDLEKFKNAESKDANNS